MRWNGPLKTLPGYLLATALAFGGAAGQSGTIVYNWVAPLDVDAPGEMAAVREAFEARRVPFVLHFTPSESLMVGEVTSPEEYRTIIAENIRDYTQGIRGMVRSFGNVRCTVGLPGVALQCNQVRQGSSR